MARYFIPFATKRVRSILKKFRTALVFTNNRSLLDFKCDKMTSLRCHVNANGTPYAEKDLDDCNYCIIWKTGEIPEQTRTYIDGLFDACVALTKE